MTTVRQIYQALDRWAPFHLAEKEDNSGLLAGNFSLPVQKVLLALDVTCAVAEEAIKTGAQLVLSHHPVIYHPLYALEEENPACMLFRKNIAVICAHTNLDMAQEGVNDVLGETLGFPCGGTVIDVVHKMPYKQLVTFVPESQAEDVYEALCAAGGGKQGEYSKCAFLSTGKGRFMPEGGASPFIGQVSKMEEVPEIRLEMLVCPSLIPDVEAALKTSHPYEEPAYQFLDNTALYEEIGFGKVCELDTPVLPRELARRIQNALGCKAVQFVDTGRPVQKIAYCSGAGGSFLSRVLRLGADAYITGDIKHDQWITAENKGLALFDAGHYSTENPIVAAMQKRFSALFPEVEFIAAKAGSDPVSCEI